MKKLICPALFLFFSFAARSQTISTAEKLAQEQLDAYNNRDIEGFLKPYSDSVRIYYFPNQFAYQGKEEMRKQYADMFKRATDLHCTLKSRMVIGNKVIDEESVVFDKNRPALHAAAIYTIVGDKIVSVHFVAEK
ncbi:MAG: SnoaL-like domain-containing protein [Chitinophagaceae bacterium]|nr:SnoaL-like domain-containing protein [Chitinophagaceae bacterium]